jgi:hypothetical protein
MRTIVKCLVVGLVVFATGLGSMEGAVNLFWVTVGNGGNGADTTGFGAVAEEYRIGEFEVTNTEYVAFLNAVDSTGGNALD